MELAEEFKLPLIELENEFAILRHCQLLKGKKEGDRCVYCALVACGLWHCDSATLWSCRTAVLKIQ